MSDRSWAAAINSAAPQTIPPPTAPYRRLPPISDPPDFPTHVVTHQQGSIRQHQETNRAAPARAVRSLPPHDEVFHPHGAPAATVDLDPHDFGARRDAAVPRTVQRDERIATVFARKLRACVERQAERRGMRLDGNGRRLDMRAIRRSVFRIGFTGEITLGPSVVSTVFDDVDVLGREVIAQIVAIVVATPQLARRRIERHADGVAQTPGEDPTARYSLPSGPNRIVRVECPPLGTLGTIVTGAAPPGSKRFTSRSSATYIVSPRNAMPNGPLRPLATITELSATPSWLESGSLTITPEPGCDAYTVFPGPRARKRTPSRFCANTDTWKPAGTRRSSSVPWPAAGAGPRHATAMIVTDSTHRRIGYLRPMAVTRSSNLPSGSTRTSVGEKGRSTRADVTRLLSLTMTSRRMVAPFAPRNSSASAGSRNRLRSGFWCWVIPRSTFLAPASYCQVTSSCG